MAAGSDPRLEQARRLITQNQQKEARALLVPVIKSDPQNIEALFLYAQVARNNEEAEKVLNRILELEPLNYQARALLNKIQRRSVEDLATRDIDPLLREDNLSTPWLQYAVVIGLVIFILGGGVAAALMLAPDEEPDPTPAVEVVSPTAIEAVVIENTAGPAPTLFRTQVVERATRELPPTWTPQPTDTPQPTRRAAPTITPRPSPTLYPTPSPTPPSVVTYEGFPLSRLGTLYYDEYAVLSAQAGWLEEPEALTGILAALAALEDSIRITGYADEPPAVQEYLDEFMLLLQQEQRLVRTRQVALEQAREVDLEDDLQERRVQQEQVERLLQALNSNATATAEFEEKIEFLKTPSLTPIVLPTVSG